MSIAGLFLVMNCRKWIVSKFSYKKLLLNQSFILMKTLFIFLLNSEESEFVIIMRVSSANTIVLDISDTIFGRSLTYKRNKLLHVWSLVDPIVWLAPI